MSKSKLNGVDPQEMIDHYGADAARLFVMFASPPEQTIEWSSAGVEGAQRFLRRLSDSAARRENFVRAGMSQLIHQASVDWRNEPVEIREFRFHMHSVLKQIDYDFQRLQYNTVISGCMKMLNLIDAIYLGGHPLADAQSPTPSNGRNMAIAEAFGILLRVLYPACPHITWQIWNDLGFTESFGDLIDAPWPEPDPAALEQDEIEMVVQVNGKLRGSIRVPKAATKEAIEQMAIADEGVARHTEGKPIKRLIVVPGKLVNVVV